MLSLFQRLKDLWKKEQPPEQTLPPLAATPLGAIFPARVPDVAEPNLLLSPERVYDVLRTCHDPEIPVNIVDLGLIYDVQIVNDRVEVKMSLTTRGCGMGGYIASEAEERIRSLPGVRDANVEIVWDPPWDPSMISPAGRRTLGLPE